MLITSEMFDGGDGRVMQSDGAAMGASWRRSGVHVRL